MATCSQCERKAVQGGLCRQCWGRALGARLKKYVWTAQLEMALRAAYRAATRAELTRRLDALEQRTRWPRWVLQSRAQELGILWTKTRPWTVAEMEALRELAGTMPAYKIAQRLGRSARAVAARCFRGEVSLKVTEGYSPTDLAECFGEDLHKVARWIARGKFGPRGRCARVPEGAVREFIRRHHGEYDLRRVNQPWFVSMAFGGRVGICRD